MWGFMMAPYQGGRFLDAMPTIDLTLPVLPPLSVARSGQYVEAMTLVLDRNANAFGMAESGLATLDGEINCFRFSRDPSGRLGSWAQAIMEWATRYEVDVLAERPTS